MNDTLQVLDSSGLQILIKKILSEVDKSRDSVVLEFESFLNFPTTGKQNTLYIDTTNNKIYRWDDDNVKFYTVGSNYEDISFIDANF